MTLPSYVIERTDEPLRICVCSDHSFTSPEHKLELMSCLHTQSHHFSNTGTVLNKEVSSYVIFETDFLSNMMHFIRSYDFLDAQRRKYGDHELFPDGESSDEAFFLIFDVMSVVRKLVNGVREKMSKATTESKRIECAKQVRKHIYMTRHMIQKTLLCSLIT